MHAQKSTMNERVSTKMKLHIIVNKLVNHVELYSIRQRASFVYNPMASIDQETSATFLK